MTTHPATIVTTMRRYLSTAVLLAGFITPLAMAQSVTITESPSPFSAAAPARWSRQPPATGNSRLKFVSPSGTPYAECVVIVKTISALRGHSQDEINAAMLKAPDPDAIARGLAVSFGNVRVISTGNGALSGIPAQIYNVQYSVGTPAGTQWVRNIVTHTITVPNISWTVGCGGQGRTLDEAQKAFDYWQLEFVKFPTFIRFLR